MSMSRRVAKNSGVQRAIDGGTCSSGEGRTRPRNGFSPSRRSVLAFSTSWGLLLFSRTFPFATTPVFGQDLRELKGNGIRLDRTLTQRWQVGVSITARGPCTGILATAPVPIDWPEQRVTVVSEDLSPEVPRIGYRVLDNGVKQMLVHIPQLHPGRTGQAVVTIEVTRSSILGPDDPSQFVIPRRPGRDVRSFLAPSPYIESRSGEIRRLTRQVVEGKESAWEQVEAMYDWVREHVEYKEGDLKGALAALKDGDGDCEELSSLFIAMCRAHGVPARTVWIPGHCYPEFYLEDADGDGHWFPCQAAGTRAFGSMPEHRPILQKGDNFKVPEVPRKTQRYVAEYLQTQSVGGQEPDVRFIRRLLPGG
jgi:hypothetical protein